MTPISRRPSHWLGQLNPVVRFGEQQLRSTYKVPKGKDWTNRTLKLFSVGLGGKGQGFDSIGKVHTNLREANKTSAGMAFVVTTVMWEVYGGSARDQHVFWTNAYWEWDFAQTIVDGTPLQTMSTVQMAQPKTDDSCGGCGAPLPATRRCEYCGHLSGDVQGITLMGSLSYNKYPVCIPASALFGIKLNIDHSHASENPFFARFTLSGHFKKEDQLG
jgi:hypothetical protein